MSVIFGSVAVLALGLGIGKMYRDLKACQNNPDAGKPWSNPPSYPV